MSNLLQKVGSVQGNEPISIPHCYRGLLLPISGSRVDTQDVGTGTYFGTLLIQCFFKNMVSTLYPRLHADDWPTEWDYLSTEPRIVHFSRPPRGLLCRVTFENHCTWCQWGRKCPITRLHLHKHIPLKQCISEQLDQIMLLFHNVVTSHFPAAVIHEINGCILEGKGGGGR